ncbi:MAG: HD domain-containing protein [Promethearchaeota archaeon]
MSQRTLYNDLLLGLITFHGIESELIKSAELNRLNHIKQLSTLYLFNSNAIHTRFHHSLGVFGITKIVIGAQSSDIWETIAPDRELLLTAALCHDIGHSAWSHVGEVFTQMRGEGISHDEISAKLVLGEYDEYLTKWKNGGNRICEIIKDENKLNMIADIIRGDPPVPPFKDDGVTPLIEEEREKIVMEKTYLGNMISGPADLDRADFLMRDSFMCSSLPGLIDVRSIAGNTTIIQEPGTNTKIFAYNDLCFAESMLIARELLYPSVYLESNNLVAEEVLMRALNKLYPSDFDIFKFWFSTDDQVLKEMYESEDDFIKRVCRLYDTYQTYELILDTNLSDHRFNATGVKNIRYIGSKKGRSNILKLEEDVANEIDTIEKEDLVIGTWIWARPRLMEAAIFHNQKLSTLERESALLPVLETELYICGRSKIVIGLYKKKLEKREEVIETTIRLLNNRNYLL